MEVYFATSNTHKFEEARKILGKGGIEVKLFRFKHREVRSDSLSEVAIDAAQKAYADLGEPVFVEDTGLFIDALKGFPGTYSGWVLDKIGVQGVLRLLEGRKGRDAAFRTIIAYADGSIVKTFRGECCGRIATRKAGTSGFGYDPIFIPKGHSQTFAQSIRLKNKLSHRYDSLCELSGYLEEIHVSSRSIQ